MITIAVSSRFRFDGTALGRQRCHGDALEIVDWGRLAVFSGANSSSKLVVWELTSVRHQLSSGGKY